MHDETDARDTTTSIDGAIVAVAEAEAEAAAVAAMTHQANDEWIPLYVQAARSLALREVALARATSRASARMAWNSTVEAAEAELLAMINAGEEHENDRPLHREPHQVRK